MMEDGNPASVFPSRLALYSGFRTHMLPTLILMFPSARENTLKRYGKVLSAATFLAKA